jgi:hypothetical protein
MAGSTSVVCAGIGDAGKAVTTDAMLAFVSTSSWQLTSSESWS